ncbi:MAG TPA: VWA domain-containing protein [Thermoanaerobaculia bacterium]|nr:VWA domain-containing protein [Thermoanaerobaculia bacterium]
MKRPHHHRALLLLLILALGGPAVAGAAVQPRIVAPTPDQSVFGPTGFEAAVDANEPVRQVELFLDGKRVATFKAPPYRMVVEAGDDNAEREFRVVATGASGATGTAVVRTLPVQIDDEMTLELQQLFVTVQRGGARALDLDGGDFTILDNGKQQQLVTFGRGELPFTAVLLVDSSESMQGERLRAAVDGAAAFVAGMRDLDEAMLALFSDRLLATTPFTQDPQVLRRALTEVTAGGGSAVADHVYMALKLLEAQQGRRVVVLLSDGAEVHSTLSMADALWKAQTSQTLVYWIQLGEKAKRKSFSSAWRSAEGNAEQFDLLERTIRESGGRVVTINSLEELPAAFNAVLTELREQYVLGYYASDAKNDGRWHKVAVRVHRPGVSVRVRDGYFDF